MAKTVADRHASTNKPVRVVVIDDLRINLFGSQIVLEEIDGVEIDALLDFDQALDRADWSKIDLILVDVTEEDREGTEMPGIEVTQRIRERTGEARPLIIAVTGDRPAWDEDIVRRRLIEAGADHFILRIDLDRKLRDVVVGVEKLLPISPVEEIEDLGVTKRTRLNELISFLAAEGSDLIAPVKRTRQDERPLSALRATALGWARELRPVNKSGNPARGGAQNVPSIPHYKRLYHRATRLPRGRGHEE